MLKTVVLATRNQGKVNELRGALAQFHLSVQGLPDNFPEIPENGTTFEENALSKAFTVARTLGIPALADDSGLEVDALHGAPGVFSARYSDDLPVKEGEGRDDRNNRKLLSALAGVPASQRSARFHCCIALVFPPQYKNAPENIIVHGIWEGFIAEHPAGIHGFGYDPLFMVPGLNCTAAQLNCEEKTALSHRGQALSKLMKALKYSFSQPKFSTDSGRDICS